MRIVTRLALVMLVALVVAESQAVRRRAVRHPSPSAVVALADSFSIVRGGTLIRAAETGVLVNDTDAQSRPLTAILVSGPSHGTLTLNANGGFTYTNDGSSATSDSFTYKASNGTAESTPAKATITITVAPPQAQADAFVAMQSSTLTIAPPGVLTNDTINQASIVSYGIAGGEQTTLDATTPTAQGGTVRVRADGGFTYQPQNGFTGSDSFKYVLTNSGGSATGQVDINVLPAPPNAQDDSFATAQNGQLNAPVPGVLANDVLNGALIVSYGALTGTEQNTLGANTPTAANGTIRIHSEGDFTYTPPSGFTGSDFFKYRIANGGGESTATVTITVQAGAPDFVVESPGFFFTFSGVSGQNPTLTLQRGRTYTFDVNTSPIHPFRILDAPQGSVQNNNIFNGILTFTVPMAAQNYRYDCSIHGFGGTINTVP